MEIGIAEAAVDLHRQRIAGRLVRLERREQRPAHAFWRNVEVETAPVGRDRLERHEASLPRGRDLPGDRLLAVLLDDAFDPHDRPRLATGELAELVPARAGAGRRVA